MAVNFASRSEARLTCTASELPKPCAFVLLNGAR
jgi:hypothetical protein